ncbi:MAG: DNA polymerase I [Oscillospiraceae bacterium]|jgi:DNA polymerase-1
MKLLAIDGNSILNRSFYGVKLLTTKDGFFTNALVGFLNILLKMQNELSPDAVAVAFDVHAPTFRHKMYDAYKGTRKGTPEELLMQMPVAKKMIRMLGYAVIEKEGYEADDIVGTLADLCVKSGNQCVVATGDRDCLQLITDEVQVRLATTREAILYTPQKYFDEYGVEPEQLVDVKALMGDSSDNIPGVKGIGEKTAFSLIQKYGSIETIYADVDAIEATPRIKKLLADGKESAFMSKELATICKEALIDTELSHYLPRKREDAVLVELLNRFEMYSYITRLHLNTEDSPKPQIILESDAPSKVVSEPDYEAVRAALQQEQVLDFYAAVENGGINVLQIPVGETLYDFRFGAERAFFELVCKSPLPKRTFDVKPLYRRCMEQGVVLENVVFDGMLAAYLLDAGGRSYDPVSLARHYEIVLPSLEEPYLAAAVLPELSAKLKEELSAQEMLSLFETIEMPLALVLASMECEGFAVNIQGIQEFGAALSEQIEVLKRQMFELAGEEFNPNSTKELNVILFEKMGLTPKKKTKSGYSTNVDALEAIRGEHAIIPTLLEYRKLTKLYSTYVVGLLKVVDAGGRVHSTFKQTETRTGRISSTEPNMQNIPARTELGRQMRRFFVAREGYVLVDADYSQIELRILAHLADDKRMLQAFNEGADIHAITASEVFGVPLELVTHEMRTRAKAINFGIVYGIGAFSLSQDIGVTVAQASDYINEYLATYDGVARFMKQTVEASKEKGYVTTMFGRRRILDELKSHNKNIRNFGERAAMNAPIQGTAADIIKIAMIRVYDRLKKEGVDGRLILQVHDELILEVAEQDAERAGEYLRDEMEHAADLNVKLLVDVSQGKTWYDAKE